MSVVRLGADQALRARLLQLLTRHDGAAQLLSELDVICLQDRDAVYEALALIDQHYRLGRINEQNYRRLHARASDIALGRIRLVPAPQLPAAIGAPNQAAAPTPVATPAAMPMPMPMPMPGTLLAAVTGDAPLRLLLGALPGRRLPRALTLAVVRDIGHAIASLQAQRLTHAAIDIDRIWITATGTAELRHEETGDGLSMDLHDDLRALAALNYELLTGTHPFKGLTASEAQELGLRPHRPPGLNRRQWQLLERALLGTAHHRAAEPLTWVHQLVRNGAARWLPAPADFQSIPTGRRWSWRGIRNWR